MVSTDEVNFILIFGIFCELYLLFSIIKSYINGKKIIEQIKIESLSVLLQMSTEQLKFLEEKDETQRFFKKLIISFRLDRNVNSLKDNLYKYLEKYNNPLQTFSNLAPGLGLLATFLGLLFSSSELSKNISNFDNFGVYKVVNLFLNDLYPVFFVGAIGIFIYMLGLWLLKDLSIKQEEISSIIFEKVIDFEINFIPKEPQLAYSELFRKINNVALKLDKITLNLNNISTALEKTGQKIDTFSNNLSTNVDILLEKLVDTFSNNIDKLVYTFTSNIAHLNDQLKDLLNNLLTRINEILNQTIDLINKLPSSIEGVNSLITSQKNLIISLNAQVSNTLNLSKELNESLSNLTNFTNNLTEYSKNISEIIKQNKELLEQHSKTYDVLIIITSELKELVKNIQLQDNSNKNIIEKLILIIENLQKYGKSLEEILMLLKNIYTGIDFKEIVQSILNEVLKNERELKVQINIDYDKIREIINSNGNSSIDMVIKNLSEIKEAINNLAKNKKPIFNSLFNYFKKS